MKVKNILEYAITFTDNAHLLKLNTFDTSSQTAPTIEQQSDIDLYLRCFNFVYKEIASAYFPLLQKEDITFDNNNFALSNLSKSLIHIKKIYKGRKALKYFIYPESIYCETDKATIIYSTLPDDFAINDNVNLFSGRVLPQVMAYGVAREFCLVNGDYADADMWEQRFKQGIQTSFSKRTINCIPSRRFV